MSDTQHLPRLTVQEKGGFDEKLAANIIEVGVLIFVFGQLDLFQKSSEADTITGAIYQFCPFFLTGVMYIASGLWATALPEELDEPKTLTVLFETLLLASVMAAGAIAGLARYKLAGSAFKSPEVILNGAFLVFAVLSSAYRLWENRHHKAHLDPNLALAMAWVAGLVIVLPFYPPRVMVGVSGLGLFGVWFDLRVGVRRYSWTSLAEALRPAGLLIDERIIRRLKPVTEFLSEKLLRR